MRTRQILQDGSGAPERPREVRDAKGVCLGQERRSKAAAGVDAVAICRRILSAIIEQPLAISLAAREDDDPERIFS